MESNQDTTSQVARPAFLIIQRGAALLEVIELPNHGSVTIGRSSSNRVVIPDAKCSREHCELYLRNGVWQLRDLNSRNGVTLDGVPITEDRPLSIGSIIGIGACTLLLSSSPTPAPPAASAPSIHNATVIADDRAEVTYEIIERKSGTQYDKSSGLQHSKGKPDHATALFRIARLMSACASEQELCQTVLEALVTHSNAELGGILLAPGDREHWTQDELIPIATIGNRPTTDFSSFLTKNVLVERNAVLAYDISSHASLSNQNSLHELQAHSAMCSPIRHNGTVIGVVHLYSLRQDSKNMTQDDLEFTLAVADQLGDQLYNLRERTNLEVGLDRALRQVNDLQGQLGVETELVGQSPSLEKLRRSIARVSPTDALVLIRGESGVGKELVARAVHFNSKRKDGPFICVNCAALTESLLESELFGHEKGAFTGAASRRAGKFEQANGGTLFLDEIGEMSPEIQAKFLRVLEGQAFERVGGGDPISVDVRVVTATNRDLEEAVREKRFRRDLFFRLQVIEITVPPLRQHADDIPSIAQHFLSRFAAQAHRRIQGFSQAALEKLKAHDWPGNVRELRNVVERAVILAENEYLGAHDIVLTKLNLDLDEPTRTSTPAAASAVSMPVPQPEAGSQSTSAPSGTSISWERFIAQNATLDDIDRLYIEAVLKATYWNKSKASRILQIERTTLDRRLKKYGLARPDGSDEDDQIEEQTNPEHPQFPPSME